MFALSELLEELDIGWIDVRNFIRHEYSRINSGDLKVGQGGGRCHEKDEV